MLAAPYTHRYICCGWTEARASQSVAVVSVLFQCGLSVAHDHAGSRVVSANILASPRRKLGDSMSDRLIAECNAAPLMAAGVQPSLAGPDRGTAAAAGRRTPRHKAPGSSDPRVFMGEGRCLDSRSSSDLTSGGDLSKAHPNYQTSTRGQAMQQVVTRGRRGNGGARCCHPRSAWAKAPTRPAGTPGLATRKALTPRSPAACHGSRRHRLPQDLGAPGPGGIAAIRAIASARPSFPHRASAATVRACASGMTYPLSTGAFGRKMPARHRISTGKPAGRGAGSGPGPRS